MKVIVIIKFGKDEKEIEVPCGYGDKTFKWLSMVAFQRFSLLSPHGIIRSRDDIRGQTDNDQLIPTEVYMESGDVPHPSCLINDFLRDGDRVYVSLQDKLDVSSNGSPKKSEWHSLAFQNSVATDCFNGRTDSDCDESDEELEVTATAAKSAFMELILNPVMLNHRAIYAEVDSFWNSLLIKVFPLLPIGLKSQLCDNWDLLKEVYNRFAFDGDMNREGFWNGIYSMKLDCMFAEGDIDRIYSLSANQYNIHKPSDIDLTYHKCFSQYVISLLYISQRVFHDIFVKDSVVQNCGSAFNSLLTNHILPFSIGERLNAVLKHVFCSKHFLSDLRDKSDKLFEVFQRYLCKSKDLPSTLRYEFMTEVLFDARLQTQEDFDQTKLLFKQIHFGTLNSHIVQSNFIEFTFPEFIETIARAGVNRFLRVDNDIRAPLDELLSKIESCYMMGIDSVILLLEKSTEYTNKRFHN